jgi:cytochrome c biogenesis protein
MAKQTPIRANYLDSLWKFFASVRLTVVVLLSLAILSIIGTLVPQNQSPADYFQAFGPFLYQIMAILDIFDMYHSWWFQCLILILVINIVICSIDRLQSTWKIIFVKTPVFNLERFRQRKERRRLDMASPLERLQPVFEKRIARSFRYCRTVPVEKGIAITAEKGRWTRLGVYGVHLSIVILLVGALLGSLRGFEGFVNIPEGEQVNVIQLRSSPARLTLPFTIRCDDFDVTFYAGGRRPKEFRSSLTILENGQPVLKKDIIVNDPLRYRGINIFQSSYGQMDPATSNRDFHLDASGEIELHFQSAASGMIYTQTVTLGTAVEIPEGLGRFVVERYEQAADFKGMDVGPSLVGTLTPKGGAPETILLPLNFPKFDTMRRGAVIVSVGKSAAPRETRYYTGLQVTKDPGVGVVYLGFIILIAGCAVTFFMSHQRLVVEVQPTAGGVVVMVSGTANKNKFGFQQKVQRITDQLAAIGGDHGRDEP